MKPHKDARGFTLFEIIVVVGLIVALAAALLPRIGGGLGLSLRNGARVIAADLKYASSRAIATGRVHRWVYDFEGAAFRLEEWYEEPPDSDELVTHKNLLDLGPPEPTGEFLPVEERISGEWRWLEETSGVGIKSIVIGEDEFDEELASVAFGNDGGADPARILITDDYDNLIAVHVLAFTGEVRIVEDPDIGSRDF